MKYLKQIIGLLVFVSIPFIHQAQSPHAPVKAPQLETKFDKEILQKLKVDVVYLASDLLEGREAGKVGEQMAADYIASRFQELGLSPKGTEGWEQPFPFRELVNPHEKSTCTRKKVDQELPEM